MKRNIWKYLIDRKKKGRRSLVYFRERAAVTGRGEGEINARSVTEKDRGVTYGRALFFQKVVKFYRCRCGIKRSKVSETQLDVAANHVNERRAPIIFLRLSARGPLLPVRDNAARNVANIPNARRGTHTHIYARTLFPTTSTTTSTSTTSSILVRSRTRKRVRGGGQRSWKPWYLISGDRLKFSFPRAISLRHGRDVRIYIFRVHFRLDELLRYTDQLSSAYLLPPPLPVN